MTPHQKGSINVRKSVQWMLGNPDKYNIITEGTFLDKRKKLTLWSPRIYVVPHFENSTDMYRLFDISALTIWKHWLIQVKTNRMPEKDYLLQLFNFKVPPNTFKELHIWHDGNKTPQILDLNVDDY